jgi:hypothetical protein
VEQPFFTNGIEIRAFDGLSIDGFRGTGAPGKKGVYPVFLKDGTGLESRLPAGVIHAENVKK